MWRQVALPVILVALSWLAVSGSTNFYLQWLDDSYQQVFDENVASMHAASLLQQELWRLHVEIIARWDRKEDWPLLLNVFDQETRASLKTLVDRAATAEESTVVQELSALTAGYRQQLQSVLDAEASPGAALPPVQDRLLGLAVQISEKSDQIRQINSRILDTTNVRRRSITRLVLWARGLAITLVPALGIALGWWTANRLQRSVARIQVTLHEPSLSTPDFLGTVQVRGGTDLISIHKQVEMVVDRLRRTGDELQAARREVVRAERLAAIGGLAAGVAHELRNPLTSVKLLLQHASNQNGDATIPAQRIGLILDEIERMETTIQGLIDFSVPARPQRKRHDLRTTIERAINLVEGRAEKQGVATDWELGPEPALVDGDPQQLHQVFVNLLINGIEAMPDGGSLSVSIVSNPEQENLTVEIHDTGVGIPPDLLPRLFEPFATGKERGTGLGLAVSQRILQEHGGSIAVRMHKPRGTTFEVTLRAIATPRAAAGMAKPAVGAVLPANVLRNE